MSIALRFLSVFHHSMVLVRFQNWNCLDRIQTDKNNQQWAMMNTILEKNGNKPDYSVGFQKGKPGHPKSNPYEMDIGKEKEDLTWLIK